MATKFYTFEQNNTGGTWDKDLGYVVIIEAENPKQANEKAEEHGLYFNGVMNGIDCPCCGDRWYEVDEYDSIEPDSLGEEIEDIKHYQKDWDLSSTIYYANGKIEKIHSKETK